MVRAAALDLAVTYCSLQNDPAKIVSVPVPFAAACNVKVPPVLPTLTPALT
jgi:hypothetical protein